MPKLVSFFFKCFVAELVYRVLLYRKSFMWGGGPIYGNTVAVAFAYIVHKRTSFTHTHTHTGKKQIAMACNVHWLPSPPPPLRNYAFLRPLFFAVSQKIVRSGEAVFSLQYVLQHLVWPFLCLWWLLCVCMLWAHKRKYEIKPSWPPNICMIYPKREQQNFCRCCCWNALYHISI